MLNRKHHFAAILKAVISYSTGNQHNESFFYFYVLFIRKAGGGLEACTVWLAKRAGRRQFLANCIQYLLPIANFQTGRITSMVNSVMT
jgi:hypothetical protein